MEKIAFKMRLKPGRAEEYKARHDAIPAELVALLRSVGICDYSIHLDEETDTLFAVLWRREDHRMDTLPSHPVMRKWWEDMADLMETKPDNEPLTTPLKSMFYMR